jgi:hypothetical protein
MSVNVYMMIVIVVSLEDLRFEAVKVPRDWSGGIIGEQDADRGLEPRPEASEDIIENRRVERGIVNRFNQVRFVVGRHGAHSRPAIGLASTPPLPTTEIARQRADQLGLAHSAGSSAAS